MFPEERLVWSISDADRHTVTPWRRINWPMRHEISGWSPVAQCRRWLHGYSQCSFNCLTYCGKLFVHDTAVVVIESRWSLLTAGAKSVLPLRLAKTHPIFHLDAFWPRFWKFCFHSKNCPCAFPISGMSCINLQQTHVFIFWLFGAIQWALLSAGESTSTT